MTSCWSLSPALRVSCAARKRSHLAKDVKEAPSFARIHHHRIGSFWQLKGHKMRQLIPIKTQKGLIRKSWKDPPIVLMGSWPFKKQLPRRRKWLSFWFRYTFYIGTPRCCSTSQALFSIISIIRFLISYLSVFSLWRQCMTPLLLPACANAKIFLAFYVNRYSSLVLTRILSIRPLPLYRRHIVVNMHTNGQQPQVSSSC